MKCWTEKLSFYVLFNSNVSHILVIWMTRKPIFRDLWHHCIKLARIYKAWSERVSEIMFFAFFKDYSYTFNIYVFQSLLSPCIGIRRSRGGTGGPDPPENEKAIWFLSNIDPDALKNHKATKPACNIKPSSACQQNAISMAFRWRNDDGPTLSGIWILSHQLKKQC